MSHQKRIKLRSLMRAAARRIQVHTRRYRTAAAILDFWVPRAEAPWPFPMRSVYRLMQDEEVAAVIRGDGSRRRCSELRQGLRAYRQWLRDDPPLSEFAVFLWSECAPNEYPAFDWADLDVDRLAYLPPRLTVDRADYSRGEATRFDTTGSALVVVNTDATKRRQLFKRRRLHTGAVNRSIQRRLVEAHRPQRMVRGERSPNVALREEQVLAMRRLYRAGGTSFVKLARQFGVSSGTVSQVVTGMTWKHLPVDGGDNDLSDWPDDVRGGQR